MRWLVALALCALAQAAAAHGIDHPRRITFRPGPNRVEVVCEIEIAGPEADGMRRLFDRDRDGKLSAAEREVFATYLEKRAAGSFAISLENKPILLARTARMLERDLDVPKASAVVAVRLAAAWSVRSGVRVSVRDGGDSEGHVPLVVVPEGLQIAVDAPKTGEGRYDLPALREVALRVEEKR